MSLVGEAFAPPAFYDFCKSERRLCDSVSGPGIVDLTAARESELRAVNVGVNSRLTERDDPKGGRGDVWRVPVSQGDCEDFAILKKKELMARGWPASALLLTVVRQPWTDDGHVLLTVRTDRGDMVLDIANDAVKPWTSTRYRYFARQSQSAFGEWERIGEAG